jgi:hypothetical protein
MLITNDNPAHAAAELEARAAARRAVASLPHVWWRHESGAQIKAIVLHVFAPELVNLLVLGDGRCDLGRGEGVPAPLTNVREGAGHFEWQREMDA